jgi:F-box and WD-40 domain protein CDC4
LRFFSVEMGGKRVFVQEEGLDLSQDIPGLASGPGWTRRLPDLDGCDTAHIDSFLADNNNSSSNKGKQAQSQAKLRKRPHESRSSLGLVSENIPRALSPPRKKARGEGEREGDEELMSVSSGSPPFSPGEMSVTEHPFEAGLEAVALMTLPGLVEQFDKLPNKIQAHVLTHLLRRSRMPALQLASELSSKALRRDFLSLLPHELAVQILQKCDLTSLANGMRVSKRWRNMIDNERSVWRARLLAGDFVYGHGAEEAEEKSIKGRWEVLDKEARVQSRRQTSPPEDDKRNLFGADDRPTPLKHMYRRRYTAHRNWTKRKPSQMQFNGDGVAVVTCLQFDSDKIVSASDDHFICVYDTATGALRKQLVGHEGGVWALQYLGSVLVTGSTDRNVRVWDLDTLQPTHVFMGHTSTVRCLQIVEPALDPKTGEYQPPYPVVVTGSRDSSLRVWRLPKKGETNLPAVKGEHPDPYPYHWHHLEGHSEPVRALAVHGRTCVSGSYDKTVRVWDIVTGECVHVLTGHEHKVYSIGYDVQRNRCVSGSQDNTVKVWDIETGTCLHTLSGHTSLVGLLNVSPRYIVTGAADCTVRVWDPDTFELKHQLVGHQAAITCLAHDGDKIVSGSEGGLKLWNMRTGALIRDMFPSVNSVWQLQFRANLLIVATGQGPHNPNHQGPTLFNVFDFGSWADPSGIDDDGLDDKKRKPWERPNQHEPREYQDYEDDDVVFEDAEALSPTIREKWRALTVDSRPERRKDRTFSRGGHASASMRERSDRVDRDRNERHDRAGRKGPAGGSRTLSSAFSAVSASSSAWASAASGSTARTATSRTHPFAASHEHADDESEDEILFDTEMMETGE